MMSKLFRFERRGFFPDGSGAFLSQNIWLLALLTKVYVIQDSEATAKSFPVCFSGIYCLERRTLFH
jgi:hypothetical protein